MNNEGQQSILYELAARRARCETLNERAREMGLKLAEDFPESIEGPVEEPLPTAALEPESLLEPALETPEPVSENELPEKTENEILNEPDSLPSVDWGSLEMKGDPLSPAASPKAEPKVDMAQPEALVENPESEPLQREAADEVIAGDDLSPEVEGAKTAREEKSTEGPELSSESEESSRVAESEAADSYAAMDPNALLGESDSILKSAPDVVMTEEPSDLEEIVDAIGDVVNIQKLPKTKPKRVLFKANQGGANSKRPVKTVAAEPPVPDRIVEESVLDSMPNAAKSPAGGKSPKKRKKKRVSLLDSYFKGM